MEERLIGLFENLHSELQHIEENMATKQDLGRLEGRLDGLEQDLARVEGGLRVDIERVEGGLRADIVRVEVGMEQSIKALFDGYHLHSEQLTRVENKLDELAHVVEQHDLKLVKKSL